jgi:hypothetical protein
VHQLHAIWKLKNHKVLIKCGVSGPTHGNSGASDRYFVDWSHCDQIVTLGLGITTGKPAWWQCCFWWLERALWRVVPKCVISVSTNPRSRTIRTSNVVLKTSIDATYTESETLFVQPQECMWHLPVLAFLHLVFYAIRNLDHHFRQSMRFSCVHQVLHDRP